jgi:ketosteroid isomerase-like protein
MGAHPYRQAFEDRDLDRLTELLADDVVFHSPVIGDPGFEGRDAVRAVLGIALEAVEVHEYTHDFGQEDGHILVTNARVLGKPTKVTTLLEFDADGKIQEIWVMARPLTGVVAIAEAVGSRLAERQSPRRGAAVRALSKPLAGLAAVTNATGGRIITALNRSTA